MKTINIILFSIIFVTFFGVVGFVFAYADPTVSINIDQISVIEGGSATITWASENAYFCRGESGTGFAGNLPDVSGSKILSFNYNPHISGPANERFIIKCTGYNGKIVTSFVDLEVLPTGSPNIDIKANNSDGPIIIKKGQPLTLTWVGSNVDNCYATGGYWYGNKLTSSSEVIDTRNNSGVAKKYEIYCLKSGGAQVSDSVWVTFSTENYFLIDLKINNSDTNVTVSSGANIALSWNAQNVSSCVASGQWSGNKNSTGVSTETIKAPTAAGLYNYTISCTGGSGSISDFVRVLVSSGSISTCNPNWQPSSWSDCVNSQQSRSYSDANNCGLIAEKPANETRACSIGCTWNCSNWGACVNNLHSRTCSYSCGLGVVKLESEACSSEDISSSCWNCSVWSSCINDKQEKTCINTCSPGLVQKQEQACSIGSSGGSGSSGSGNINVCTDSDNGKSFDVKGIMSFGGVNYEDSCFVNTDKTPSRYLKEYYCENNTPKFVWNACNVLCDNGACAFKATQCQEKWVKTYWSDCDLTKKIQTMGYNDENKCGTTLNKPVPETQPCGGGGSCTSNWYCAKDWSNIPCEPDGNGGGTKTRTCTDLRSCDALNTTKVETQSCSLPKQEPRINLMINNAPYSIPQPKFVTGTKTYLSWKPENVSSCLEVSVCGDGSGSTSTADDCNSLYKFSSTSNLVGGIQVTIMSGIRFYRATCFDLAGNKALESYITEGVSSGGFDSDKTLPTVDAKINGEDGPVSLPADSTATISWTSHNATTCGGSSSASALNGSDTIKVFLGSKTYTARCSNAYGNATDTVTVIGTSEPVSQTFPCVDNVSGIIYNVDSTYYKSGDCQTFINKIPQR